MKRRMLVFVMMLCMVPLCAWAEETLAWFAEDGEVYNSRGEHFTYVVENECAVLTRYWTAPEYEQPSEVIIPATLNGLPLKAIADGAFNCIEVFDDIAFNGNSVDCLVIPEGVTALQPGALSWSYYVDGIRLIQLPSTLVQIPADGFTFELCFAEISFPNGNPFFEIRDGFLIDTRSNALLYCNPSAADRPLPRVSRIENMALANWMPDQTVVEFPDSVQYIGSFNAYDCINLEKIIVPGSVLELADHAFQCNSAKEIILNEGLRKIGYWTFADDTEIESLTIPSTVTWIGYEPFGWWEPEEGDLILLNPDVHWETEEEYLDRT